MGSASKLKLITSYSLVFIVVLTSLFIRFFRVGDSPPSVNWDEASLGYTAYSLLHTGRDEYAKALPISLRSFDDYKPAVYSYLIVPWLVLRPLSDITTRLPSVIMGALLSFSLYVITYLLTKSRYLGIISAVLIAFEPWALHFSRVAFEANAANSLIYLALALFLYSVHSKKFLPQALVMFIISTYTYHSERIIAIPLLVILLIIYRQNLFPVIKKQCILLTMLFVVLFIPLGINFVREPITSRLGSTNIFRLWPFVPKNYPQVLFNPLYALTWQVAGRALAYYSPYNLFVKGSTEPAQYVPTLGLLNMIEFPFWAIGLLSLITYGRVRKFLLPILILAPLPAIITWNWFSVVRTLTIYPVFTLLVSVGLFTLWQQPLNRFMKYVLLLGFVLLWGLSALYLVNTEIIYSPSITYGDYQPGFEQSIPVLMAYAPEYDHIVIDSPHIAGYIFLLFYNQYDPRLYQHQVPRRNKNSGTESIPFGKFEFREIDWIHDKNLPHTLFLGPTVRLPDYEFDHSSTAKIIRDLYDVNGYISLRLAATN